MSETASAAAPTPATEPTPTSPAAGSPDTPEFQPAATPAPTTATTVPEPTAAPEASLQVESTVTASATPHPEPTSTVPGPAPEPEQVSVPAPTEMANDSITTSITADEPQNTLTKKFTEAEWKSLSKFRTQLPDIFANAYPDNPKAREQPIALWGITIDPAQPQKDARVSVILMKFLRARNLSVSEARDMLVNTLRWRESFGVAAALKEEFPPDIFENLGHIYGRDNEGRPVTYNVYGGNQDLKSVFGDVQRFIRWRVALMEKSVAELDFVEVDQMLQIHDYEGVSLTSRDANSKAAAAEATNIFQSHYPELLYKKFFVNIPTLLNWIFWAFKPLLSANTLAKMTVVGTSHHAIKKALLPYIEEKELPKRYGGDAEAF
ncbi:hypothetical protein GALMADRAFT_240979 [Galerina marginata CBS 339.88]|uniref:Phosphatidylinositol transfer protein SFH5 n=1 Tax=Galerina marginata (strain CBS 339.88) TaxID=685588 RepID=A0A067TL40_GALM3|nr:hypothetical protein GALMADRAFT_240979 [Galerina marginata CBS 339.88]